jgi:hypothetical protein
MSNRANPAEAEDAPAASMKPRDAVVVLGGLHRDALNPTADAMARRLARALDRNAQTGSAEFLTQEAKEEDYKEVHKSRVITVVRRDGQEETPVADVYELSYSAALTAGYRRRPPILQALMIGLLLIISFPRLVSSLRRRGKTVSEKAQVVYGGFLFLLLAAYVPVLIVTVVGTVQQVYAAASASNDARSVVVGQGSTPADSAAGATVPTPAEEGDLPSGPLRWFQLLVISGAALGIFRRESLKDTLSETSAHLAPALAYLDADARSGLLRGQFYDLLEHLAEKAASRGITYDRVHIVGYSFGSLVAIDAIFPLDPPGPRLAMVDTLVTIGCPFDFIRTYWPDYFDDRHRYADTPRSWLNIYATLDVLSSDFRDTGQNPVDRGVRLKPRDAGAPSADDPALLVRPGRIVPLGRERSLTLTRPLEYLALGGFKAHAHYWEQTEQWDTNCFDIIVRHLYADTDALR